MKKIIKTNKKIIFWIWLSLILLAFLTYTFFPKFFSPKAIMIFIDSYYLKALIIFCLFLFIRGFLLIPPLIITISSLAIFDPLTAFLANTLAILVSTFLIYKASRYLDFDIYLKKFEKPINQIKDTLQKKEIAVISAWSFFSFFPTDLIVYTSASLKIPLWKCLLGVFIGTAIINAITIYSLGSLINLYKLF